MDKFDFNKIKDFDRHINLSIPNYDFLKENIIYLIEALTENETKVLDLGCSTGSLLFEINKLKNNTYIGYDISNLLPEADYSKDNLYFKKENIIDVDLPDNASVISSIFTLQFLPTHKRKTVIDKVYESLNKDGYFIVCEKIHAIDPCLESITNAIYYKYKGKHFSSEEILKKQQGLTSVMKLKTMPALLNELNKFSMVEVFWKSYGFCGIIARK